jgi:hypothetical protein
MSIAAFAFGWLWNTYIRAFAIDGHRADETQTISTATDRPFNALFWLLLFALLSGLISYGWQRGWRQLGADLASLPRQFAANLSTGKTAALSMVLSGVSLSLIIATVITPAVSLALGLVVLTLAATPVGVVINFALVRLWKALSGMAGPNEGILSAAPFMLMAGEGFGLVLDWVFDSWLIGLIAGILCAVLSLVIGRSGGAVAAIVLFGGTVTLSLLNSRYAFADDGGWSECQFSGGCSNFFDWFSYEGASTVMATSTIGGLSAGAGTAIGAGLGSVAATVATTAAGTAVAGTTAAAASSAIPTQGSPTQGSPPLDSPPQGSPPLDSPPQGSPTAGQVGQDAPSQDVPTQGSPATAHDSPAAGQAPPQGQAPAGQAPAQGQAPAEQGAAGQAGTGAPAQGPVQQDVGGQGVPPQAPAPGIEDYLPDAPDKRKRKEDE